MRLTDTPILRLTSWYAVPFQIPFTQDIPHLYSFRVCAGGGGGEPGNETNGYSHSETDDVLVCYSILGPILTKYSLRVCVWGGNAGRSGAWE